MSKLKVVLLSGGSGTRLWPLSREAYPKQFLPLVGEHSLLQATWLRVRDLPGVGAPLVVANEEHRFIVAEQLQALGAKAQALILEPVGRNTAPAIAVAAMQAMADGTDPVLLVLPSDHVIADEAAFRAAVMQALPTAEAGGLVTFGIVPRAPETGYGYIKASPGEGMRPIERFVEKPDQATAQGYLASGDYFWNSGMFLLRASRYLEELGARSPGMLEGCQKALAAARTDLDFLRLDREAFAACPADSIDYAVMEKTERGFVLPIDVGWNDVGSWSSLADVSEHDAHGNARRGDVVAIDTRNTLAWGERRLLALIGLEDMVVVDTDDALLVARRDRVQDVKQVVDRLKREDRTHARLHRKVFRPWGSYDGIENGPGFQVKRIAVKPGASLSLQMHHHRAEHWIIVRGTARVTCDENVFDLHANQSTYIPLGSKHRLQNVGSEALELIEVQSGDYLGEDDIVRFEDVYGRN
ncbi:MAG: mannose-1-phosphate guanylyltransferase/mannose-6-phosphate isomerase [Proteobacteria bacterium]|nr:mannose-1-phosphate guanylyltransferase/mannose-6-phosphate isomerase [Pseudomonadota bacterium]